MQPLPNPLLVLHQQAEAEFQNYAGVEIVSTFGQPQVEYSAVRKGCAIMDLPHRGILQVSGKDRLDFLNRFLTNELINKDSKIPLPPGSGRYAFLLNNKGRIVADMNVLERGEHALLETDARIIPEIQTALDKFVFSEKVQFSPQIGQLHQIMLHGPKSLEILQQIDPAVPELPILGSVELNLFDVQATVFRDDPAGAPGYGLILPAADAPKVWTAILSRFAAPEDRPLSAKRQVWPLGWAAYNSTRIEAGRPLFGIDFDNHFLPAETAQLSRAVSFTKGCYLGQEIVARMHARSQAARQIVGIRMDGRELPIAGAPIFDDKQNQIGGITSSTMSPILSNSAICLGVVKSQFALAGTKLHLAAEGAIRIASVASLPFYPAK